MDSFRCPGNNANVPVQICRSVVYALAVSIFAVLFISTQAIAQIYRLQTIDVSNDNTFGKGINNGAQVVGVTTPPPSIANFPVGYVTSPDLSQGPLLDTTFSYADDVNHPNQFSPTFAYSINRAGVIVGTYSIRATGAVDGGLHGFILSPPYPIQHLLPTFDPPGGYDPNNPVHTATFAYGINDNGDIVGSYVPVPHSNSAFVAQGFLRSKGVYSTISFPGAQSTVAFGINNAGQIVGGYVDGAALIHGFLLSQGAYTTIDFPGGQGSVALGINNFGAIVGGHTTELSTDRITDCFTWNAGIATQIDLGHVGAVCRGINDFGQLTGDYPLPPDHFRAFLATPSGIFDPVPDLLNGPRVVGVDDVVAQGTGRDVLATLGRPVNGVAADGVSQVLIRIPAASVGDQFLITLQNDAGQPSASIDQDGALGPVGSTQLNNFGLNPLTVTAMDTSNGPFAFALYRAPVDFSRGSNFPHDALSTTLSRQVTLTIDGVAGTSRIPVIIVRPPLVFIHGIWGSQGTWKNFADAFPGFQVGFANYTSRIGPDILTSDPLYPPLNPFLPPAAANTMASFARANSLGFQYNAPGILTQIRDQVRTLKLGSNPAGTPVAAIQADIVAHSMGGDISRTLPLQTDFLRDPSLGQGEIHKLISIDTPYKGSPFSFQIVKFRNVCVRNILAVGGQFSFSSLTFLNFETVSGGIGDMQGDGHDVEDAGMSPALTRIAQPVVHPLPTALIFGIVDDANLSGLDTGSVPLGIRCLCGSLCPKPLTSPLADNLTSTGWKTIFAGENSDAIVSENSQLDGHPGFGFLFSGVHSGALNTLGFGGPSVLDPGPVPAKVLDLLNTPVTDGNSFHKLPQP